VKVKDFPESALMTTAKAARVLGISTKTVIRLGQNGDLRAIRLGPQGRWRIVRAGVDQMIRETPTVTRGAAHAHGRRRTSQPMEVWRETDRPQ
jgi:excisionase family DNA binding protein